MMFVQGYLEHAGANPHQHLVEVLIVINLRLMLLRSILQGLDCLLHVGYLVQKKMSMVVAPREWGVRVFYHGLAGN